MTLKVRATDERGIRRVTIAAGKRKAAAKKLRLPRRAGRVKVTVRASDKAGNVTTVTRTLRVR